MTSAQFLAAVFALSTLDGVAGEKQIIDVKELAETWQGWATRDEGHERATRHAAISIVANDRDGEPLRRPRQDRAQGDACGPAYEAGSAESERVE